MGPGAAFWARVGVVLQRNPCILQDLAGRRTEDWCRPILCDCICRVGYGSVVRTLPPSYRVVTHRGNRYYGAHDNYYQRRGNGYIVVRAPF